MPYRKLDNGTARDFLVKLLDDLQVASWDRDLNTDLVVYGRHWANMLGYDIEEIKPNFYAFEKRILLEDLPSVRAFMQEQITDKKEFAQIEFRMLCKDKSIIWVQLQSRILDFNDKGEASRIVAVAHDLTKLKEAQSGFKLSTEFFKMAVDVAGLGVYDFDVQSNTLTYSDAYLAMLGYEKGDLTGKPGEWQELVHPDDLKQLSQNLDDYLNGLADIYTAEARFRCKDGSYLWIKSLGRCIEFDADGRPTRLIGGHFNIDALKTSQKELLQIKKELENDVQSRTYELVRQDEMLWTVNEIARNLLEAKTKKTFDETVYECLNLIGKVTNQSRIFIWKSIFDETINELCCSQIYELTNDTFSVQGFKELEKVPYTKLPSFLKAINTGNCLNNLICNLSDGEKEVLMPQDIKSILIAPINIAGEKWGFIGIDNCKTEELFSDVEENMLLMSGFLLASAIEKRQIEYKRNQEQEMNMVLFEYLPFCCKLWDKDFNLITCNYEALRLFGFSDKQELMKRYFDLMPEFQPTGKKSKQEMLKHLQEALDDGRKTIQWMYKKLDGELVPVEQDIIRIKYKGECALAVYTRDLRDVYKAQEQAREAEERNKLMLNTSPVCSTIWDRQLNMIDCNDAALRLFQLESKEEFAENFEKLSPEIQPCGEKSADLFKYYMNKTSQEGDHLECEWLHCDLNGNLIPVLVNLYRIKYKDDYVLIAFLIDQRKTKAMLNEIQIARDEALAHSKAKSDFLAKMSHEIRTPMNAIVGMTELLLREDVNKKAVEYAHNIKQAGDNLLSVINDILDFSKIESGRLEIVESPYLLSSLVNDVVSIVRIRIMDKQVAFVVEIDPNLPNALLGDETRIRQSVLNILNNAVKYTKEGHISLKVYGESLDEDSILLHLQVQDTGIGIRKEDVENLFNEFAQFDFAANKGVEGTGLGLTITKNFCQAMGGDISVQSTYGKGSTFTITVPQVVQSKEKIAKVQEPEKHNVLVCEPRRIYAQSVSNALASLNVKHTVVTMQSEYYNNLSEQEYDFIFMAPFLTKNIVHIVNRLSAKTRMVVLAEYGDIINEPNVKVMSMPVHSLFIANTLNDKDIDNYYYSHKYINIPFIAPTARVLIVDDIATNLKVAEGLMAPFALQIDTCESGYEALGMLKENEYDVIFMDHMMPDMDGIETTLKIRQELNLTQIPVVALTANAIVGVKEMFLANGFNDFLSKPIEMKKLSEILETWIPKAKQEKYSIKKNLDDLIEIEINNIDIRKGVSLTGGSMANYIKVLTVFCKDGIHQIKEIGKFLQNKDTTAIANSSHALKSALHTIGATNLSGLAEKLEHAGKNNHWGYIKENMPYFLKELDILITNIKEIVSEDDKQLDVVIDENQIKRELKNLKQALENLNAVTADKIINTISNQPLNEYYKNALEQISEYLLVSEYDEAVKLIDKLIV